MMMDIKDLYTLPQGVFTTIVWNKAGEALGECWLLGIFPSHLTGVPERKIWVHLPVGPRCPVLCGMDGSQRQEL